MPWVKAVLRGQKVFARADEGGRLVANGGRVEIRYKPNDGRRYDARADNLAVEPGAVLPDDACGAAEVVAKPTKGAKKGSSKGSTRATAGPHSAPEEAAPGSVIAYADGACSGNPGPAGAGVVVIEGKRRIEISEYLGEGTNNIAELTAILRALEAVDSASPLTIHTDSQYSIGVLQKGWKAKANAELIAEVREVLGGRRATRLAYVPGHAGVPLNERADELARLAVTTRASTKTELG